LSGYQIGIGLGIETITTHIFNTEFEPQNNAVNSSCAYIGAGNARIIQNVGIVFIWYQYLP
jgi:hypothetical protein